MGDIHCTADSGVEGITFKGSSLQANVSDKYTDIGKSRLRLNYPAISDILSGNAEDVLRCQQEYLIHLGRVILGLCVNSSQPFQGDQQIIAQCMDMVRKNYSVDLFNLITYLLQPQKRRTVDALMPMIGARFYTQLDSAYLWGDVIEGELEKEVEN